MNGTEAVSDRFAELGVPFAEMVRLAGYPDRAGIDPDKVVSLAAQVIPNAQACAITLLRPEHPPKTLAATADLARRVDRLQYEVRQGPCLDASIADDMVYTDDLIAETRWPAFTDRCVRETGVRSMCGVRLALSNRDRAAMNLYSQRTAAFDDLDVSVAAMLAPLAALATEQVLRTLESTDLHAALTSNRQIGRAIGILMARQLVTSDQAFELLRRSSQHLNRKLRDVAEEVEFTGDLPPAGPARGAPPAAGRVQRTGERAGRPLTSG